MLEIINQKYMKFLFEISKGPKNISELAKKGDLTLSVASTLISRWARENVAHKQKSDGKRGKEIIITLTEYGVKQVNLLKELNRNHLKNKEFISKQQSEAIGLVSDIENDKREVNDGSR
ncbi:MAG: hypothetical protein ACTSWD_04880 [Candidatus Heimdallarchaeota archaeon]